jgi:hypothetical protein
VGDTTGTEDEPTGSDTNLLAPHGELELPLDNQERLVLATVDMRRWPAPGGTNASTTAYAPAVCSPVSKSV